MLIEDKPVLITHLNIEERKRLLDKNELFSGFNDRELDELVSLLDMKYYPIDFEIFAEGSLGAEMYIIIKGKVCLTIDLGTSGWTKTIVLNPNSFFGEMSLLDNHPRSAGAVMHTEGILITLDQRIFQKLIKKFPKFAINIMKTMSERIRKVNEMLLQLGQHISGT
ncbi:MAG: Crp/Fnr family transcriptional regulator [Candidatus Xenobiia bacterium LiM19]